MKLLSLLLFFLGLTLASCNLTQFGLMILQVTGKWPLAYNGYGCCCGWRGTKQPVDATDRCCHAHYCCYKRLVAAGCRPESDVYKYTQRGTRVICGSGSSCERRTCACDKEAVECFKRTAGSYRKSYANYPQSKCKGQAPSC